MIEGKTSVTSITQRHVLRVNVNDVQSKPQVRRQFNNIDELADSIRVEGQQTPIIVSPKNRAGKYVIQKGERRWRACKHAGLSFIDIIVADPPKSELDATAGELIENIQRDNLTGLEIAHALQKFIADGWKQIDIAKRLGKSTKFISSHLALLKLPACVAALYDNGHCTDTDTLNTLRQLYELDARCCEELCQEAAKKGIHRQHARDALNETFYRIEAQQNQPYPPAHKNSQRAQGLYNTSEDIPWTLTPPDKLRIIVQINAGPHRYRKGALLTDRFCKNGKTVWLRMEDSPHEVISIRATQLKIVRLETAGA